MPCNNNNNNNNNLINLYSAIITNTNTKTNTEKYLGVGMKSFWYKLIAVSCKRPPLRYKFWYISLWSFATQVRENDQILGFSENVKSRR